MSENVCSAGTRICARAPAPCKNTADYVRRRQGTWLIQQAFGAVRLLSLGQKAGNERKAHDVMSPHVILGVCICTRHI